MLDEILEHNAQFITQTRVPHISHAPRKHTAIVTCMDCRLVNLFETALGLERGDVLELRTAGATISEDQRSGSSSDLIRSLAGGIYLLGVSEVIVIGHTHCGLAQRNPEKLIASMQANGVDPQRLIAEQGLKDVDGLLRWLGVFEDLHLNVQAVVNSIRTSPFLPRIPVHGLVIDIETGALTVVDRAR